MCSAAAVYSVKEKAQAGRAFEHGRWSLDGKVLTNAIGSKWSTGASFHQGEKSLYFLEVGKQNRKPKSRR
jgi:hypothetical protein